MPKTHCVRRAGAAKALGAVPGAGLGLRPAPETATAAAVAGGAAERGRHGPGAQGGGVCQGIH